MLCSTEDHIGGRNAMSRVEWCAPSRQSIIENALLVCCVMWSRTVHFVLSGPKVLHAHKWMQFLFFFFFFLFAIYMRPSCIALLAGVARRGEPYISPYPHILFLQSDQFNEYVCVPNIHDEYVKCICCISILHFFQYWKRIYAINVCVNRS